MCLGAFFEETVCEDKKKKSDNKAKEILQNMIIKI